MATRSDRERRERRYSDVDAWLKKQSEGYTPTIFRMPEGYGLWKPKPGTYNVDFFSYWCGRGNPNCDPDFLHYERQYDRHYIPTPDGGRYYACLWHTFLKPEILGRRVNIKCPVCSWIFTQDRAADAIKRMKAQQRRLWLLRDRDEKGDKVHVFDAAYFNRGTGFGEMMKSMMDAKPKYRAFARPVGGYTLTLTIKEQSLPGSRPFNVVTNIIFDQRDQDYPEEICDSMPCLDDMVIPAMPKDLADQVFKGKKSVYDFTDEEWSACAEELESIFRQGTTTSSSSDEAPSLDEDPPRRRRQEEDQTEPPTRRRREDDEAPRQEEPPRRKREDTEEPSPRKESHSGNGKSAPAIVRGSKVKHRKWGLCEVQHVNRDGSLRIEDKDADSIDNVPPGDVELMESGESQQEAAPRKSREEAPRRSAREDEDDDKGNDKDEDLVDDDDPEPQSRRR